MFKELFKSTRILMLIAVCAFSTLSFASDRGTWSESAFELDGVMDLGHWRSAIADRIYPNFYNQLDSSQLDQWAHALSHESARLHFNRDRYNQIAQLISGKNYFFTFDYDHSVLQPVSFSDSLFQFDQLLTRDRDSFRRSLFAPGVAYRVSESSEVNLAVIFAQQNYSDVNFLASEINDFDQLDLYAVSYTETSNGLGLKLGMKQKLSNWLSVDAQYQSKIDMDGFSRILGVQADPADFDIPEQIDVTFGINLTDHDMLQIKAKHSIYSDINAFESRSYPDIFLTFLNDAESPDFLWDDHTEFAVSYERRFNTGTRVNVEYAGRQQPPATDADLTTILHAISASYSVRVGLSAPLFGGELDLYASYAPKPLNFGRTDFGRVNSELKGKHTEAVLSWLYTF